MNNYWINQQFIVRYAGREIKDTERETTHQLEPRIAQLLQLLVAHQNQIVSRELIAKEVWDDYPGANEGINQAISRLRKILADEQKTIIETMPKAGYRLNADLSFYEEKPLDDIAVKTSDSRKRFYTSWPFIGAILIAGIFMLLIIRSLRNNHPQPIRTTEEMRRNDSIRRIRQEIREISILRDLQRVRDSLSGKLNK